MLNVENKLFEIYRRRGKEREGWRCGACTFYLVFISGFLQSTNACCELRAKKGFKMCHISSVGRLVTGEVSRAPNMEIVFTSSHSDDFLANGDSWVVFHSMNFESPRLWCGVDSFKRSSLFHLERIQN